MPVGSHKVGAAPSSTCTLYQLPIDLVHESSWLQRPMVRLLEVVHFLK